jgi:eukaryotic-like serine/threonine-protein kinase
MRPENDAADPTQLDLVGKNPERKPIKEDFIGRVLDDRYRIDKLLGEGGMGAVFVAEHLKLHKMVALKIVRAELAGNGEVAARFAREAMATAQFEHPHVASAIDYGTLPEGGAYFVMQLVQGKSLARLLEEQKRLPWPNACDLAAQVADALTAAEEARIVHRDLKPENILIETRSDGSQLVRILDFGIAHVPKSDLPAPEGAMVSRELTKLGAVMGTPGYMAPEQAVGELTDHRTDLYALGVVLWESITGIPLWNEGDITTLFARQLSEVAPSVKQTAGDRTVPDELDRLVRSLLERSPKDRPAHAASVRDALRGFSKSSPASSTPVHAIVSELVFRASSWASRWNKQPSVRKRLQLISVFLVLLAGIAVVYGITNWSSDIADLQSKQPPTFLDKTVTTIVNSVRTAENVVKPAEPDIPTALEKTFETMKKSKRSKDRRIAAQKILDYKPETAIAPYIRNMATLEAARGCRERAEAIRVIREAGDKRTLPTLRYLSRMPKHGCGFLNFEDCNGCIRNDLDIAIQSIEDRDQEKQ